MYESRLAELEATIRKTLTRLGALPTGTTFQWLIERGQPEQQEPTVWLDCTGNIPPGRWTGNANEATKFPVRDDAERVIADCLTHPTNGPSARAVEHGWFAAPPPEQEPAESHKWWCRIHDGFGCDCRGAMLDTAAVPEQEPANG